MELLYTPLFGLSLTVVAYLFGVLVYKKTKLMLLNPMLVGSLVIIAVLLLLPVDYEAYLQGADVISVFLVPATVCFAIPIYHKRELLKKNWLPLIIGCAVGAVVCIACVWALCKVFGLDETLTKSLIPKSITTPFGIAVSESIGGIPAITVMCIIITGLFGAIFAPYMIRLFRVKNPIAAGLAIGTSSHVLGTTKALEIGETEGAMSGLAISITGIITVIIALFL